MKLLGEVIKWNEDDKSYFQSKWTLPWILQDLFYLRVWGILNCFLLWQKFIWHGSFWINGLPVGELNIGYLLVRPRSSNRLLLSFSFLVLLLLIMREYHLNVMHWFFLVQWFEQQQPKGWYTVSTSSKSSFHVSHLSNNLRSYSDVKYNASIITHYSENVTPPNKLIGWLILDTVSKWLWVGSLPPHCSN